MEVRKLTIPDCVDFLDFLASLEEMTKSSWIFIDSMVLQRMTRKKGYLLESDIKHSQTIIINELIGEKVIISKFPSKEWYVVCNIESERILFKEIFNEDNPRYILVINQV